VPRGWGGVAYIARKSFDLKPCEIEADAALRDFYVPTAAENIHSSRMSHMGLGCVKTPELNLRTEISFRLPSI
jgi:hypothetical protein